MTQLVQPAPGLHPTKRLLHQVAPTLAHLVTIPAGDATVDGTVTVLVSHVRDDGEVAESGHEALGIAATVHLTVI